MSYDWQASLAALAFIVVATMVAKYLVFRVPALRRARAYNLEEDAKKLALEKYPPVVKISNQVGLLTNAVFFVAIAPWLMTLSLPAAWKIPLNVIVILMIYDFFYYFTHRFLFHGNSFLRQVHALHHQARSPTHIDAYYVHPLETFIGVVLFMAGIVLWALVAGPLDSLTVGISFVMFTQWNVINHTRVDLPYFPFKTVNWITTKHAVHHQNMHKGNYASITLLFDKLFGTLD
jgi:sterol desaturase/sphingolipid hydroxylase (fatty acid hydroxylase superfamily)